jgi:hypothetical protein
MTKAINWGVPLISPCHKDYNDKIYTNYTPKKKCPAFDEESGTAKK